MILFSHQKELLRWASEKLDIADFGQNPMAIGVVRNEKIAAVAVYHFYRHPNIEISFVTADPRWATRSNVAVILRYPFIQLRCKRITAITSATNLPARAFLCRLGFKPEGFHPDVFETDDAVTYGLLERDAQKWIAEGNIVGRRLQIVEDAS